VLIVGAAIALVAAVALVGRNGAAPRYRHDRGADDCPGDVDDHTASTATGPSYTETGRS